MSTPQSKINEKSFCVFPNVFGLFEEFQKIYAFSPSNFTPFAHPRTTTLGCRFRLCVSVGTVICNASTKWHLSR